MSSYDHVRAFDALGSRIDVHGLRTIAFTSAVFGEGVSTLALGTSLALAQARGSVLLIDANWLQPSLTIDAALERSPGLADHLGRAAEMPPAIRGAGTAGVAFLPVGDRASGRPRLRDLSAFLAAQSDRYRAIVVDLPPVLAGEGFVLPWASLVDRLFLVVREGATPLPLARQAIERIGLATPPDIVLNRREARVPEALAMALPVRT